MIEFSIHGPFEIPRRDGLITRNIRNRREFWQSIEQKEQGLPDACGCYVFSVHGRVWYVGKASWQSFKKECFTPHKVMYFNEALHKVTGTPELIFIAHRTPARRFSKPCRQIQNGIEFLEEILIGIALRRNRDLLNIKGTKLLQSMVVPGILNTQKGTGKRMSVRELRKVLGLSPYK